MQRATMAMVGLVLAGWGASPLDAQEPDPGVFREKILQLEREANDARRTQTTGRGVIRGSVTAAATGAPVRGATVRAIFGSGDSAPVSAMTDDTGGFELRGLAAGSWRVSAAKSGFVPREFGQRGATGRGSIITLTDRTPAAANIALWRGAAVAGRVLDEFGDPAVGTRVQAMRLVATDTGSQLVPAGVPDVSDDTGAFRLYGLMPGDYLVSARAPTPFDADTFIVGERMVEQRLFANGAGVPRPIGGPRATASTYFPGTTDISVANRITVEAGEERTGIDFSLMKSATVRVAGTLTNSAGGPPPGPAMIALNGDSADLTAAFALAMPVNMNGTFEFRDVPEGSYRLTVAMPGPGGRPELADVPLRVTEDTTGVNIVTAPGVTLTGTIVADTSTLPRLRGTIVHARPLAGRRLMFQNTSGAVIDGGFQVPNLLGTFRIAVDQVPAGWILKAIEIDGVDVTDTPVTFAPGQRPQATIVLTNRITELSGTITDERKPVDAEIAIFPDDPARWTSPRFVRSLRASSQGSFSLRGLPPHDNYLAVATEYLEQGELQNPEFLEQLRSRATAFSLREGESRSVNLPFVQRSDIDGR